MNEMREDMKRILIDAYCVTNFGDDLFVKLLCDRYPKTKFYINCSRFDDTAFESIPNLTIMNRKHFKGMIIHNFKKLMNKIHLDINFPYDGQVYIGGSIFPEPDLFKASDWNNFIDYHQKKSSHIPFYLLGINFGPYHSEIFKQCVEDYLKQTTDVCFRDQYSYQLFSYLPQVRYAPDIIFQCPVLKQDKKNNIVISVIYNDERYDLKSYDNDLYIKKLALLVDYYHDLGKQVTLVTFCKAQKDHLSAELINQQVKKGADILQYQGNLQEIIDVFSDCEYVIGTRFHSIVMAMNATVPVYPIIYNDKTSHLLDDLSFQGQSSQIQDFYKQSIEMIDANRINHYVLDIAEVKQKSAKHFQNLDQFIGE